MFVLKSGVFNIAYVLGGNYPQSLHGPPQDGEGGAKQAIALPWNLELRTKNF